MVLATTPSLPYLAMGVPFAIASLNNSSSTSKDRDWDVVGQAGECGNTWLGVADTDWHN